MHLCECFRKIRKKFLVIKYFWFADRSSKLAGLAFEQYIGISPRV